MLISIFAVALVSCTYVLAALKVVDNEDTNIYITSQNGDTTVGYSFLLQQNVLTVRLNATKGNNRIMAATLAILPNLILEYNATFSVTKSNSVRSFLDFHDDNGSWDHGLVLNQSNSDVFIVKSVWNDPVRKPLRLGVIIYVASKATTYQGIKLRPNEITIFFSILNYPFILSNSLLAFDQLVLTGAVTKNITTDNAIQYSSDDVSSLFINTTALVDGKKQSISESQIEPTNNNTKLQVSNTTNIDVSGLQSQDILLTFGNSYKAKNVTFEQRLVLNTTMKSQKGDDENSAITFAPSNWIGGAAFICSLFAFLPVILL